MEDNEHEENDQIRHDLSDGHIRDPMPGDPIQHGCQNEKGDSDDRCHDIGLSKIQDQIVGTKSFPGSLLHQFLKTFFPPRFRFRKEPFLIFRFIIH